MCGFGELYETDGQLYVGYFKNDQKNGLGVLYSNDINNTHLLGNFIDNKLDGRVLLKTSSKINRVLFFKNNTVTSQITDEITLKKYYESEEYSIMIKFYNEINKNKEE